MLPSHYSMQSGHGENYPIDFYDVEYDADTGIAYFSS